VKKILSSLAALSLVAAPTLAHAAAPVAPSAAPLSLAGMATPAQGDEASDAGSGGGGTAIAVGFILIVLLGVAAISGNSSSPNNTPASP